MSAKLKNVLASIATLCVLAAASGLLLGVLNKITYVDPNIQSLQKFASLAGTTQSFETVEQNKGDIALFAKTGGSAPYYAYSITTQPAYSNEVFTVYVIVHQNKIIAVDQNSSSQSFLDDVKPTITKYINTDLTTINGFGSDFEVSGATLTSRAIKNAVNSAVAHYKAYLDLGAVEEPEEPEEPSIDIAEHLNKLCQMANVESFVQIQVNYKNVSLFAKTDSENAHYGFVVTSEPGYQNEIFDVYVVIYQNKIIAIDHNGKNQTWYERHVLATLVNYYNADLDSVNGFGDEFLATKATFTSTAIRNAVNQAVEYYKSLNN